MIRIRPEKKLLSLETLLPGFKELPPRPEKSRALLAQLRQLAQKNRNNDPQRFYSIREVATFFRVDPMVVNRAYRQLHTEGILISLKSSMTMLSPIIQKSASHVRGVVGIPVWNWGFCHHAEWRETISALETNLRQQGFVADLIFIDKDRPDSPAFLERLLMHRLDYLLWYKPQATYTANLHSLAENGVRPIVINNLHYPFPFPEYRMDMIKAWTQVGRTLQKQGIKKVMMIFEPSCGPTIIKILQDFNLVIEYIPDAANHDFQAIKTLLDLKDSKNSVFIPLIDYLWSEICYRNPQETAKLLDKWRVINLQRMEIYPEDLPTQKTDMLRVDPHQMAVQIASDIALNHLPLPGSPHHLRVDYLEGVPAHEYGLYY